MTRNQLMSAVMRLTVRPGTDGIVAARPLAQLYLAAAGAFTRAGAGAWLWFMKRTSEPLDENAARAEFFAWLKATNGKEIDRFIEAANRYRPALLHAGEKIDKLVQHERVAYGENAPKNERGTIWKGAEGRALWRITQREAGRLAQKSNAGEKSGEKRGGPVKTEVLRLAEKEMSKPVKPRSRSNLAGKISAQLSDENARSQDRVDAILKEAGILEPKNIVRRERRSHR